MTILAIICYVTFGYVLNVVRMPRTTLSNSNESLNPNTNPYSSANVRFNETNEISASNHSTEASNLPGRSFLPVVDVRLRSNMYQISCKALLDSGSEINILKG